MQTTKQIRNQIVAVIQAVNKPTDFAQADIELLEMLSVEIANHFDRFDFVHVSVKRAYRAGRGA